MKVLRLKLYQQTACYKKPFASKVAETYPLPPHSTVKGMLHAVLEANELIPMQISVQGGYDTLMTDYQIHYFFKQHSTPEFILTTAGLGMDRQLEEITTMPIYTHMLYDVNLVIHVQAEQSVMEELERRIKDSSTTLSLGRWEDLLRVDECEIVELIPPKRSVVVRGGAFVPQTILDKLNLPYSPYRLNWTYDIVNGVRVWKKLNMGYVQEGTRIRQGSELWEDPTLSDDSEVPRGVFFAKPTS